MTNSRPQRGKTTAASNAGSFAHKQHSEPGGAAVLTESTESTGLPETGATVAPRRGQHGVREDFLDPGSVLTADGEISRVVGGRELTGRFACTLCHHDQWHHNNIQGCPYCTCMATCGEAGRSLDEASGDAPILSPTRALAHYTLRRDLPVEDTGGRGRAPEPPEPVSVLTPDPLSTGDRFAELASLARSSADDETGGSSARGDALYAARAAAVDHAWSPQGRQEVIDSGLFDQRTIAWITQAADRKRRHVQALADAGVGVGAVAVPRAEALRALQPGTRFEVTYLEPGGPEPHVRVVTHQSEHHMIAAIEGAEDDPGVEPVHNDWTHTTAARDADGRYLISDARGRRYVAYRPLT